MGDHLDYTVSPWFILNNTETEFYFESSFKMKPSTEILKRELAEKNRIRQKGSRFKEYQNRKRRFKPQNPRFIKSKSPLKGENLVTSSLSEKNLIPDSLIPKSFPKFDKIRTNVDTDTGIKKTNSSDSLNENFETTNMERNRVVLINSKLDTYKSEESVEKELAPKYLLSTTSRTLSSDEKDFISKPSQKRTESAQNILLMDSDIASFEIKKEEDETNSNEKPFVRLGVSIEEVENTTDDSKVRNDDTEETKVNNDNDMADQALYR